MLKIMPACFAKYALWEGGFFFNCTETFFFSYVPQEHSCQVGYSYNFYNGACLCAVHAFCHSTLNSIQITLVPFKVNLHPYRRASKTTCILRTYCAAQNAKKWQGVLHWQLSSYLEPYLKPLQVILCILFYTITLVCCKQCLRRVV